MTSETQERGPPSALAEIILPFTLKGCHYELIIMVSEIFILSVYLEHNSDIQIPKIIKLSRNFFKFFNKDSCPKMCYGPFATSSPFSRKLYHLPPNNDSCLRFDCYHICYMINMIHPPCHVTQHVTCQVKCFVACLGNIDYDLNISNMSCKIL
jgi:hypothetical protein